LCNPSKRRHFSAASSAAGWGRSQHFFAGDKIYLLYTGIATTINAHRTYAWSYVMRTTFSAQAPKKATNLSLNSELLAEAKRLNINLSATMEKALEKEVAARLKAEWLAQNADSIRAYNELTEKHGLFSDPYRVF
jgi:antitoxin CcdA